MKSIEVRASGSTIYNLQALRAIAALLVVFVHLAPLGALLHIPEMGAAGVDIFFVISGFIMAYTTERSGIGPLGFLCDRLCRVAPMYWAITLVVFLLAMLAPGLFQSTVADYGQLVKSILFIPFEKRNGEVNPVLFVGWSLNYEMFFYAIFALAMRVWRCQLATLVTIVLVALAAAGLIVSGNNIFFRFYSDLRILEFVFGIWIAKSTAQPTALGALGGIVPLSALALACLVAAVALPAAFPDASPLLTCGLCSAVLVWCVVRLEQAGAIVRWRWALVLGNASYALYLTHPFVTDGLLKVFLRFPMKPVAAVGIVVSMAVAAFAAVLVSRYVEMPLTRLARRVVRAPRLRPANARLA
jgi:peptidoglycan/LPS O-acetylase OafA/YrhL